MTACVVVEDFDFNLETNLCNYFGLKSFRASADDFVS